MTFGKLLGWAILILIAIQFIPYGKNLQNPPVTGEPAWDSPHTKDLFFRACGDCHSNETVWPWYSNIAPVSWLLAYDVTEGREHFNVSEWGRPEKNEGEDAAEEVMEGNMPPFFYLPAHPEANLDSMEKQALIDGLKATFGSKKHHEAQQPANE